MSRRLFTLAIGALITCTLSAGCSKPGADEKSVAKPVSFKAFGKDFVIQSANDASEDLRMLGRATAIVRYASGGSGTGFFVSQYGLFLTNHHVMSHSACSATRCGGIQIIRDFKAGGDIEVFNKAHMVLASEELDFALIQVELPPGKTVPYLELEQGSLDDVRLAKTSLFAIGHPAGASQRVTELTFRRTQGDLIQLNGPAFWGNSGSPLVDRRTGLVVGLVSQLDIGAHNIDREGNVSMYPEARRANVIRDVVMKIAPDAWRNKPNSGNVLSPVISANLKILLPKTDAEATKKGMTFDLYVGRFFGKAGESEAFGSFLEELRQSNRPLDKFHEALWVLGTVASRSGRAPNISVEQKALIRDRLVNGEGSEDADTRVLAAQLLSVLTHEKTANECLNNPTINDYFGYAAFYCLSSFDFSGRDVFDYLRAYKQVFFDKTSDRFQQRLRAAYQLIESRLDAGTLRSDDRDQVLAYLQQIARDTESTSLSFKAEALYTLLQRDTSLVGKNSFANTF